MLIPFTAPTCDIAQLRNMQADGEISLISTTPMSKVRRAVHCVDDELIWYVYYTVIKHGAADLSAWWHRCNQQGSYVLSILPASGRSLLVFVDKCSADQ